MKLNYIKYLWSKTNKFIITALIILSSLFVIQIATQSPTNGNTVESYVPRDLQLFILMLTVISSSAILPILVRKQLLSKQNCDTLLSLPIKRTTLFILTSLYTYIVIVSIFTIMFILGIITYLFMGMDIILGYLILYYLTILISSLSIFIIVSAVMSFANNILDCILLFILTLIISLLGTMIIDYIFRIFNLKDVFYSHGIIFSLDSISYYLSTKALVVTPGFVTNKPDYLYYKDVLSGEYLDVIISVLIAIPSTIIYYKKTKSFKSYNVGDRSDELIFKVLIPIVFFILAIYFCTINDWLVLLILSTCYFVGWFIVYRKISFTKYQIISYGITLSLILLTLILK